MPIIHTFMTEADERAFSQALLDRHPDVMIMDALPWQTRWPVIRASIAECSSSSVFLLKTEIKSIDFYVDNWIGRRGGSDGYGFQGMGFLPGLIEIQRSMKDGPDPASLMDGWLSATFDDGDCQTEAYLRDVRDLLRRDAVQLFLLDIATGACSDRPERTFLAWPDAAKRYDGSNGCHLKTPAGACFLPAPARLAREGVAGPAHIGGGLMASRLSREVSMHRIDSVADIDDDSGVSIFRTCIEDNVLDNLTLPRTYFGRCLVQRTSFRNTDLSGSTMRWADFVDVDFSNAVLAGCDARSCIFSCVKFVSVDLSGADLRRTSLEACDFAGAGMQGAILTRRQGRHVVLSDQQRAEIAWVEDDGPEPDD